MYNPHSQALSFQTHAVQGLDKPCFWDSRFVFNLFNNECAAFKSRSLERTRSDCKTRVELYWPVWPCP